LLKRRNLCEKHKQLWTSKVHCDCFIFLVYGSVFATHRSQQKVKPPVSHAPISKETVFRKIYFILAYAETIIKRFSKGVI